MALISDIQRGRPALLILIACMLFVPAVLAAPAISPSELLTAGFSVANSTGPAPLSVSFTDLSTGDIDSWEWAFGDGTSSSEQHPVHLYETAGTYDVTLTVSSGEETDAVTEASAVVVSIPDPLISAGFEVNISAGPAPLSVLFTDLSTGDVDSWEWAFGDESISSDQHPVHLYETAGTYDVTLTVSAGEETSTVTEAAAVVVTVPESSVSAGFDVNVSAGPAPLSVLFTDLSGGDVDSWEWAFGDGNSSSDQHPVHLYETPGEYDVTLTVTAGDETDTVTEAAAVVVSLPKEAASPKGASLKGKVAADFTFSPSSGNAPLSVQFRDLSTGSPDAWSWEFGDGEVSLEESPVHLYKVPGTYDVTLTVARKGVTDTVTETAAITVEMPVSAKLSAAFSANATKGAAPFAVRFADESTGNPDSWSWNFGEEVYSSEQDPLYVYEKEGTYSVSLIVANAGGSASAEEKEYIVVTAPAPTETPTPTPIPTVTPAPTPAGNLSAAFIVNTSIGKAPLAVQFIDNSSGGPDGFFWDFGDGAFSNETSPVHLYEAPGSYDVIHVVTRGEEVNLTRETDCIIAEYPDEPAAMPSRSLEMNTLMADASPRAFSAFDASFLKAASYNSEDTGWCDDWGYRVKMWIDADDINETLYNVPVLVHLSDASGADDSDVTFVFDELSSNNNRDRIAITRADNRTECYAEIERWQDSDEESWLWVRIPVISADEDTILWLYYDSDHDHNTAYVGDIGDTPAENVWGGFGTVYHMVRASNIADSTSAGHNARNFGAADTAGIAGRALDFSTDYLRYNGDLIGIGDVTVSSWVRMDTFGETWTEGGGLFSTETSDGRIIDNGQYRLNPCHWTFFILGYPLFDQTMVEQTSDDSSSFIAESADGSITTGVWTQVVEVTNSTNHTSSIYINGNLSGTAWQDSGTPSAGTPTYIGDRQADDRAFDGRIDELRITSSMHTPAQVRTDYLSVIDDLVHFGPEEERPDSPVASFSANQTTGTAPLDVGFTDTSTGSILYWDWEFGDGNESTVQDPVHTFVSEGTYQVNLTVTGPGGNDTATETITVDNPDYLELEVIGSLTGWTLNVNDPSENEDTGSVQLNVTSSRSWRVTATDDCDYDGKPAGTVGRMAEFDGSSFVTPAGAVLATALRVNADGGSYVNLSGTSQEILSGTQTGTGGTLYDAGFRQQVGYADERLDGGDMYRIVVTYTASAV